MRACSEILFWLGVFLIPFENFKFAPSAGWAAIAPIFFTLYSVINVRYLKNILIEYWKIVLFFIIGILITAVNYIILDTDKTLIIARFIDSTQTIVLGAGSLMAFHVYFIEKKNDLSKVEQLLLVSYTITLLIGVIQFIAIKANLTQIMDAFELFTKRNYYFTSGRVQFFFTESSFVGMHLYGVLLPIYLVGKNKKIRNLIIIYALAAIVFGSGVRILVDTLAVCFILIIYGLISKKRWVMLLTVIALAIGPVSISYMYNHNDRVHNIVDLGIYADASLGSRYFYIQSAGYGLMNDPVHALCGYGIGQEPIVLEKGYEKASPTFRGGYRGEIDEAEHASQWTGGSATYNMYMRILSEYGIVMSLFVFGYIIYCFIKVKDPMLRIAIASSMYLYIQFESYAFYSIWLVIIFIEMRIKSKD